MIANATKEIKVIIDDIQHEFDQDETELELRADFDRTEAQAINRDEG